MIFSITLQIVILYFGIKIILISYLALQALYIWLLTSLIIYYLFHWFQAASSHYI